MATPKYASLDGEIVAWADARVHIASAGFKFGTAVFEGLRGYWNAADQEMYLFRMAEHMDRLNFSQRFMRFDEILTGESVTEKTVELIQANGFKGENLHIMTTAYVSGMGGPGVCGPIGLAITAQERPRSDRVVGGVTAQVSSWMRVPDNAMPMRVKCNANYNNGRLATVQAVADGYDTAIFLNSRGKVSEGPGMCFFMIRDGVPITPSVTNDILESITRDTVLELIEEIFGVKPVERDVDRSELMAADEAFFCGTAWEVTPVLGIDRVDIGKGAIGPMTKRLQDAFFAVSDGTSGTHSDWRMPVYGKAVAKAAE
ncbi:MAG: branched-chain-amino-acid transaminase [Alphaproteobacteria bacterium]|nr:branched-chain-amino-acid transaminase [Alphaproteobacteria bacterium]